MRRSPSGPPPTPASGERHDWQTIKKLLPYLWAWKWRVMFALGCLIGAKFANVTVPLIFKQIVDGLDISRDQAVIVVPAALLELRSTNGVIRAQWPTALWLLPRSPRRSRKRLPSLLRRRLRQHPRP